jgi:hypothetical protein
MRNTAQFASGLHVAWLHDAPEADRESAEWKVVPVDEVAEAHELGRRIDMVALAGGSASLPRLVVEPAPRKKARVWSTTDLIVQDHGEVLPRVGGASELVAPGTVARVGPLTVAVLTAKQAEAVSTGRLTLSRPSGDLHEVATNGRNPEAELSDHVIERRLKVWSFSYAAALAAATAAAVWATLTIGIPLKGSMGHHATGVNDLGGVIAMVALSWIVVSAVALPLRSLVTLPSRRA